MELTLILAYIGAVIIGLVLGLIGGGGSILTVPVLVYLLTINPVLATAYSLFIVGTTSAVGAFQNLRNGLVDLKTAFVFAVPALISVYIARKYIVPIIPDELFTVNSIVVSRGTGIMVLFAIIMLLAAFSMIHKKKAGDQELSKQIEKSHKFNYVLITAEGLGVGFITGIVGAGGGFLIIPALVLLAKLPMKRAVATSLLIIAVKSLIGFVGDVQNLEIDWGFLLSFTLVSIVGIFIGIYLNRFVEGKRLKKSFGWFVLAMAIYILCKEIGK